MSKARRIFCGNCNIEMNVRIGVRGDKIVSCLQCGTHDTLENAWDEFDEHQRQQMLLKIKSARSGTTETSVLERKCRFVAR